MPTTILPASLTDNINSTELLSVSLSLGPSMTIDLAILLVAWQLSRLMTSHPDVRERERETEQERRFLKPLISTHSDIQSWTFFSLFFAVYWKCMGFEQLREKGLFCVKNIFLQNCNPGMYWGLQNSHYFGTVSSCVRTCTLNAYCVYTKSDWFIDSVSAWEPNVLVAKRYWAE